jgi:hypothetical protein
VCFHHSGTIRAKNFAICIGIGKRIMIRNYGALKVRSYGALSAPKTCR